jgi:amino acid adenylation domain-containing protein
LNFELDTNGGSRDRDAASDIAIVGMAGRFPEADSIHQFFENLCKGRDSVREISLERKGRTSLSHDEDYQVCGYIEEIDTFDYAFFGISKREAQNMAPEQRLLLQVAYQAVENAGYAPDTLNGLRASVYAGDMKLEYHRLAQSFELTMLMGNHVSATVGRISRFFGLCGPSATVDSSCSSSLLAVHLAVNDLRLGEADLALVCGASLDLFPDRKSGGHDIGIKSADGKTRCFSAEAAGTGSGEVVACIVLKRLDQALRDGHPVHAVIKGVAANHVAGRSSTLTAPDSVAQAEVIQRAWEKAGIDPTTISYIEAHGTATRLGDPIEIEAIDLAFSRVTAQKRFCALSSVKTNVGHTWSAAGIAGLIKAVLSLKHRVLFPNLHCANLSPLIDFAGSAVVVTRELTPWEPPCGVRRAGVSSFGVMGTNVHAILEEAPLREDACHHRQSSAGSYWIPISAKSAAALESNVAALKQWIDCRPELSLADIQHTLVRGRSHYPHRFCATAACMAELSVALEAPQIHRTEDDEVGSAHTATVLLLSGDCGVLPELTRALRRDHPRFDMRYAQCERAAGADKKAHRTKRFAFQYAFYGLLRDIGLEIRHVLGQGAGKHVVDATLGRLEPDSAIRQALLDNDSELADIEARVDRLFGKLEGYRRVLFVEAGPLSTVSRALISRREAGHSVVWLRDCAQGFATFLRDLYIGGAEWQWSMTAGSGRPIELPSYQFQRIRCWMEAVRMPSSTEAQVNAPVRDFPVALTSVLDSVIAIWKEVLGLEELSTQASFFDLGGDSISGIQVINRIQTMFGIELDQGAILEHETPLSLARYVEETQRAEHLGQVVTVPPREEEYFGTSPAQLHVWLASQFKGGSVAFNLSRSFRLDGTLETHELKRALNAVAGRHDALRGVFAFIDETLLQRTLPDGQFSVPLEEQYMDEPFPVENRLTAVIREFVSRPFNLEQGPLLRAQLVSFRENQHVLTYSTHHIVADGWSLDLLTRDLAAFYASFSRRALLGLPPVRGKYRDYHQQKPTRRTDRRREAAAEYWLARFDEEVPQIDLPRRPALGGFPFSGAYRKYLLPSELYGRLKRFSQIEGRTVFVSTLSAFAALFSRYTDQDELVLGTSVAGRNAEEVEQLVGMFVRTLPLRLRVDRQGNFRGLVEHVRSTFSEALRHADYSYEELIEELQRRGPVRSPRLFDVLIEFEQFAQSGPQLVEAMAGPALQVTPLEVHLETSVFPLNIMFAGQADCLEAYIRFDTRLFDAPTIDQLWDAFVGLLDAALNQADDPIERLNLLSESDQLRIRTLGYQVLEFDPAIRVHHAIERFAALTPNRVCVSCGSDERTYASLNSRANQIARFFAHQCQVQPEEVVALIMDRSILMVEVILALWKCGAAYLPIDPGHPPSFVRTILELSRVRLVALDPSRVFPELMRHIPGECEAISLDSGTASDESCANLDTPLTSSSLAYVIYTSGSTGVPKGVMVEHLGLINHLHAKIADLLLSERSVVVQNASNSFDVSVWQMFAAPFVGGRTTICEESLQLDPFRFVARLNHDRATVLEVVPSYLETMLDAWDQSGRMMTLDCLEFLVVTGEPALPQLINRWIRQFPCKPVVNAYGPTEASDDVTHHVITGIVKTDSVPLGRPIPNTYIYVLDENQRLCPQGAKGEICVSGICVGRGYMNAPEQTARVFVTDPFQPGRRMYRTGDIGRWTSEGTLEYFGRKDSQVKVRGFRIELGEVERRLSQCPAVKSAALIMKDATNASQMCAYVVLVPGGSVSQCRAFLSAELPEHMVPAHFAKIDRLPLTSNGKVDRQALQRLELSKARSEPLLQPRSETERILTQIWEQVLGREGIAVTDKFFDLGGNSLRAIQVLSRVRSQLGVDLKLEALFQQPTISSLATQISMAESRATDPIRSLGGAGVYDVALTQNLLLWVEENYSNRDSFNRNDLYRLQGNQCDPARLERSFALLIKRHESLRTTYDRVNGKPVQIVHEVGALPLPFSVHDFSQEADAIGAGRQFIERRIRTPFQIAKESLIRVDLIRVSSDTFSLLVSMHQLISDGRSADVLIEDWLDLYQISGGGRDPDSAPLGFQYKDAAHWRNEQMTSERLQEHREFWRRELEGASSVIPLPTDYARPTVSALEGACLNFVLPRALSDRIVALASDNGVTEFVVAQCAVCLLLVAETGLTDITIGTYTQGRNRVDLEDQIGFYIRTVPLRFQAVPDGSVRTMLIQAQNRVLRAFQHEEYPYEWIMRDLGWCRGLDRSPLFDVMIAMDTAGDDCMTRKRPIEFERQALPRRAKEADLVFAFERAANRLELILTYNTELFSLPNIWKRAASLQIILEGMVDNRVAIGVPSQNSF